MLMCNAIAQCMIDKKVMGLLNIKYTIKSISTQFLTFSVVSHVLVCVDVSIISHLAPLCNTNIHLNLILLYNLLLRGRFGE